MKPNDAAALKAELTKLYADLSKHSAYQSIPEFVADSLGYRVSINEEWRGDRVRLDFIMSRLIDPELLLWTDFGANTGFFSLTLAHAYPARRILAVEANANHADFIRRVAQAFSLENLEVIGRPIAIDDLASLPRQDVLLHLNVLHHAGADFDRARVTGPEDFIAYAETYLQRLHGCARTLVFQIGTNLWGNKALPFVAYDDDAGKLSLLLRLLTRCGWDVSDVAYAARLTDEPIRYESLPLGRDDLDPLTPALRESLQTRLAPFRLGQHIGEFYRRPLFICRSSH